MFDLKKHMLNFKNNMNETQQINKWQLCRIGIICLFAGSFITFIFLLLGSIR